jgi:hypothetical protein
VAGCWFRWDNGVGGKKERGKEEVGGGQIEKCKMPDEAAGGRVASGQPLLPREETLAPFLFFPGDGKQTAVGVLSATGTNDSTASQFAPQYAPTAGKTRTLQSILDKIASEAEKSKATDAVAASAYPVKQNNPLTSAVNGLVGVGGRGLEPPTPSLSSWCSNQLS